MPNNSPVVALVSAEALLDDLLRLAAASDCVIERVVDLAALRARWSSADTVLLDPDACLDLAQAPPPRRQAVVVVSAGTPPDSLWEAAVRLGAEEVLELPSGEAFLAERFADLREAPAERVGRIVSVIGARGGAGASVFAGALGVAAAGSGRRSLLVDCDPLGSGLDVLFGLEDVGGLRWPDLTLTTGRIAASALHEALVSAPGPRGELTLLSGARSGSGPTETALHPVLDTSKRAGDLVVCDLPRSVTGPAAVAIGQSDLVVVLVPAEVRACGCARRLTAELAQLGASIAVVVRGPAPGGLRASDIAAALDLPPVAVMRPEPGLDRRLEQGRFGTTFRGPLIAAARQVLAHVDAPLELGVR